MKINCDGACVVQSKTAAVGVIARNNEGRKIAGVGKWMESDEPEEVEVMAIKQGIIVVKEKGYQQVIIESDSKIIVEELNNKKRKCC